MGRRTRPVILYRPRSAGRIEGRIVANIKSQKKRILTNAKAAARNKAVRSELKTRTKNALASAGSDDAVESLRLAQKKIDKAAAKGVIHPNQAARRKSRLAKRLVVAE